MKADRTDQASQGMARRSTGDFRRVRFLAMMRRVRRGLLWVSACAAAAWASAALAEDGVIEVGERTPLAFVISSPTGASARTRTSDLIRLIDDASRRDTGLAIQTIDETVTKGCRGRLLCVILRIRTDYEREALREPNGRMRPYADHLAMLNERKVGYPKLLLFITNITREGEADKLSAQLIDTDRALETYHLASHDGEDWEANVEALINEAALTTPRTEVSDETAAETFVQRLFLEHLRPSLEASNMWRPFGQIDITTPIADLSVSLDGASIGITQRGGLTRLTGVRPGTRHVSVEGPDIMPFTADVEVAKGETATLVPELSPKSTDGSKRLRTATLVAGAVAVVAGGVFTGLALATPDSNASTVCFRGPQSTCESGSELVRSSFDPDRLGDQNGSGILLAPLGYSLIFAGATWGLGTWFFTEEREVPWLPLLGGLGVGVLSYTLSALLNPSLSGSSP